MNRDFAGGDTNDETILEKRLNEPRAVRFEGEGYHLIRNFDGGGDGETPSAH